MVSSYSTQVANKVRYSTLRRLLSLHWLSSTPVLSLALQRVTIEWLLKLSCTTWWNECYRNHLRLLRQEIYSREDLCGMMCCLFWWMHWCQVLCRPQKQLGKLRRLFQALTFRGVNHIVGFLMPVSRQGIWCHDCCIAVCVVRIACWACTRTL